MGKQRVSQLLAQLKENQQKDIENAAGIFTVAQVAVDALNQSENSQQASLLPPVQAKVTKKDLLERYGSFNGCRSAARKEGIIFSKTPSWPTLEAAFSYREAVQQLVQQYLATYPNRQLEGVSLQIDLFNQHP